MICPDCKERKAHIKCNSTGNVLRCSECEDKKREEIGLPTNRIMEIIEHKQAMQIGAETGRFKPYKLKHGPLHKLKGIEPSLKYSETEHEVLVKNRRHEDWLMKKLGTHIGEHGEDVLGHEIGKTKPIPPQECGFVIKE